MESTQSSVTNTAEARTVVRFRLPFALHGASGLYQNSLGEVVISLLRRPPEVLVSFMNASFDVPEDYESRLVPDNFGLVHVTDVALWFRGLKHIEPPDGKDASVHHRQILDQCDRMIRPLVDWYAYTSRNFGIRRFSLKEDALYFEMWHHLPNSDAQHNHQIHFLLGKKLHFSLDPLIMEDSELQQRMLNLQALPSSYQLAINLFTEAMRALHVDDPRLATVQAVSSSEIALTYYVEKRIKEHKDELGNKRLSLKTYQDMKRDVVSISSLLNLWFPLLLPQNQQFPKGMIDSIDRLRKLRNKAVHAGENVSREEVEQELPAVEQLIEFLISLE